MKLKIYQKITFLLSLAGFLFAGFLSSVRFVSETCAFNEPCPYFLGFPACYTGFILFAIMFIVSAVACLIESKKTWSRSTNMVISLFGVLFAGYFVIIELPPFFNNVVEGYDLGLPTCLYGFVFFVAIAIVSFIPLKKK